MSKFKKGDKVKCIRVENTKLELGCVETVKKVGKDWLELKGIRGVYFIDRFELASRPHKHAKLIKAWADNPKLKLQWRELGKVENWIDVTGSPAWSINVEYRIKPEPKPDVVVLGMLELEGDGDLSVCVDGFGRWDNINIKAVFDGETKRLKDLCIYNRDSEK